MCGHVKVAMQLAEEDFNMDVKQMNTVLYVRHDPRIVLLLLSLLPVYTTFPTMIY